MSLLNDKLNTWAGTDNIDYADPALGIAHCFKWLVPKLDKKVGGTEAWITGLDIIFSYGASQGGIICGVRAEVLVKGVHHTEYSVVAKTPALALCLAIKKLIDSEKELSSS